MELASDLKTDANILKPHVYTTVRLFAFLKVNTKSQTNYKSVQPEKNVLRGLAGNYDLLSLNLCFKK